MDETSGTTVADSSNRGNTDVRIYSRALSAQEVAQLARQGKP